MINKSVLCLIMLMSGTECCLTHEAVSQEQKTVSLGMTNVLTQREAEDLKLGKQIAVICDVSRFRFNDILKNKDSTWLIGVTQIRQEGGFAVPLQNDPKNGTAVPQFGQAWVKPFQASLIVENVLAGQSSKNVYDYQYGFRRSRSGVSEALGCFPLEETGQVIICRLNPETTTEEEFSPRFMIPPEWIPYAKPALHQYETNNGSLVARRRRSLSVQSGTAPDKSALQQLLNSTNQFLAVAAYRELAESSQLDNDTIVNQLSTQAELKQSVLTFITLFDSRSATDTSQRQNAILAAVSRIQTNEQLKGIALGALAYSDFTRDTTLMTAIGAKEKTLSTHHAADEEVTRILQIAEMRSMPVPQPVPVFP